ncbi:hypothetical protein Tco_1507357 [Tanacetum coccineum]
MIVSGQSGTLVWQRSACNHGCGHRLHSACVLRKGLICVCLEISGPPPAYPGLNGSSLRFRDTPAFSAAICLFRKEKLIRDVSLYLLDMDLLAFIQVVDPIKVKVGERECAEGEARLLDSTVGCVVPLLPVALARADSDLEASVDRLFDEGVVADENVVTEKPKRLREKRQVVTDASGSSHPPKKLRGDHRTSSGAATGGKSPSVLKELLASSMLNVEVGVATVATLPMVTSSVSATPEHESGVPADSITGLNLRTIGASERFVISLDSSHHSGTNAFRAQDYSIIRSAVISPVMTESVVTSHAVTVPSVPETGTKVTSLVHASMFHDSDSTETVKADVAGPSYSARQDLSMGSRELDAETQHQVFVSQWKIRKMDYHHLFTEFNVRTARQACLNAEVRMRTEYCLSERKRLESECKKQADLLKARDEEESLDGKVAELQSSVSTKDLELKDLNVAVSSLRSQKDGLVDQVHALETICSGLCDQLDADLLEMALHLEEKFYPHLLTTISGQRWLLTHGLKLAIVKCLNYQEYLSALGAAINRAIEKGMQDELSAGINHGKAGPLVEAPGMNDLQPNVDQLMIPIHWENVAVKQSARISVWTPLVDPLSAENLVGEAGTSSSVPATIVTTTAMSITFASASSIPLITIEDYEIVGTDGPEDAQGNGQGNVASFSTFEFEKEDLDTTPERDPPS